MKEGAIERFLMHLHPKKVSIQSIKTTRTFGLGGINALLFIILTVTGILLRFSYVPTVAGAYDSIMYLQDEVLFGRLIRNLHHFSAHLMVITSFLHLIRVFYAQAYYRKRAKNWIYGMLLFLVVLFFNFTGYLLPWDQLAFWAVTVVTQVVEYIPFIGHYLAEFIKGGDTINGSTLLNFYNLHTSILPILMLVLMSIHFWLVRMAGGVATPTGEQRTMVITREKLVPKEALVATAVTALILLVSVVFNAPLEEQANPVVSPNPNKAPWYFLGAQELLLHMSPFVSAFLIPMFVSVFFFVFPYFNYKTINSGVWFHSERGRKMVLESFIFTSVLTLVLIFMMDYVIKPSGFVHNLPTWIAGGILPLLLYLLPMGLYVFIKNKKHALDGVELVLVITTAILSSYVVMLLVSQFLRGAGMQLFAF